jgi:protein gp37
MSDTSRIEWTEATWNPVTGCHKVSQGCKHCYAERDWKRLTANPLQPVYHGRAFTDVAFHAERLQVPLLWTRPRRIFVNSMSDLFHEAVPFEFIDKVFAVMSITCRHTYQVLTKRPARMLEYFRSRGPTEDDEGLPAGFFYPDQVDGTLVWPQWTPCKDGKPGYDNCGPSWPLINLWLGVSIEDQATADERIPLLLQCPSAIAFVSYEPALGAVDLSPWVRQPAANSIDYSQRVGHDAPAGTKDRLDWVIAGGESGSEARPSQASWFVDVRDQCARGGVPFFFKQWGTWVSQNHGPQGIPLGGYRSIAIRDRDEVVVDGMYRCGKKVAGRVLDGREHDEYPPERGAP